MGQNDVEYATGTELIKLLDLGSGRGFLMECLNDTCDNVFVGSTDDGAAPQAGFVTDTSRFDIWTGAAIIMRISNASAINGIMSLGNDIIGWSDSDTSLQNMEAGFGFSNAANHIYIWNDPGSLAAFMVPALWTDSDDYQGAMISANSTGDYAEYACDFSDGSVGGEEVACDVFLNPSSNIATINGSVNFAADAQADDDYEIPLPEIDALTIGLEVSFIANTANTGGATLEITSVGLIDAILKMHDQALVTGDIEANQYVKVGWDGTNWQMLSQLAQ